MGERMRVLEGKLPKGSTTDSSITQRQSQPVVEMYARGDSSRGYNVAADSTLQAGAPVEAKEKTDKAGKKVKDGKERKKDKEGKKAGKEGKKASKESKKEGKEVKSEPNAAAPTEKKKRLAEGTAINPEKKKQKK